MDFNTANNSVEQQQDPGRHSNQFNLTWAEDEFSAATLADMASQQVMADYGPQPLGVTPVDQAFETTASTGLLLDEVNPFNWPAAEQSESSVVGQYGPEYSQSNTSVFNDFANQGASMDGLSYFPTPSPWNILASNTTPPATRSVQPNAGPTYTSSPKTSLFDQHFTNQYMKTTAEPSPSATLQTTLSLSLENIFPSVNEDRYLAAAGLAALPLMDDEASLSAAQDHTAGNFQWYGVEPTQRGPDADNQNGGPTSYNTTRIVAQQAPRAPPTKAEREYNDKVLLECKQRGESYKQIREKLLGEKPAESTLRGRYRMLTKALNDRVRKPVWTKTDILLLRRFVSEELDRVNAQVPHADSLTMAQKLARISWKKVADSIKSGGGTYQFGVTTCKKKWIELNTTSRAPRAAADAKSATFDQRYV